MKGAQTDCRNQKASLFFGEKCKLRMIMWWRWFTLAKHLVPTVCFIKKEGKTNCLLLSNSLSMKGTDIACSCTATFSVEVSRSYCAYTAACTRWEWSSSLNPCRLLRCGELNVLCFVWRSSEVWYSIGKCGRKFCWSCAAIQGRRPGFKCWLCYWP